MTRSGECGTADGRKRILVVDDELALATTISEILKLTGYDVTMAHSGEEAIEVAQIYRPDLLLSDVCMPGMNGFDAAAAIVDALPLTKVLFLTGVANLPPSFAALKAIGSDFEMLAKPIPPSRLLDRVAAALAQTEPSHPTVLYVDDNDIQRYAITKLLTVAGYVVKEVVDVDGALVALEHRPDAVLLDVHLPDGLGFDVHAAMKTRPEMAGVPVFYVTSQPSDDRDSDLAFGLGAAAFFSLPADIARICSMLKTEIAKHAT